MSCFVATATNAQDAFVLFSPNRLISSRRKITIKKISMIGFLVLTLAFVVVAYSSVQTVGQSDQVVPGQFIVVLHDDVDNPADVAQELKVCFGDVTIVSETDRRRT